ncbi:MAG: hypothetical protein ISS28_06910 [Candidatus Cloacimonetes bacterium]|nr:hypothetical protein [Candidatus Cloacimonadota bacterium]MBL7086808.1 hypothetical protein [Candidatus Cloacimonadota bacterium]
MNSINLSQIEKNINLLSRTDQLRLIERILRRWRQKDLKESQFNRDFEQQLTAMAEDKEIQRELQKNNREFIVTEMDGLRTT